MSRPRPRFRVIKGGEPTPEELAAIAVTIEALRQSGGGIQEDAAVPASGEWALSGRMQDLHWEPLAQRWPGEASGNSWRRAVQ